MDEMIWTPLSWAIEGRHGNIVKLLLGAGAKVHYKYNIPSGINGKYRATTPLSRAAEKGAGLVVKHLVQSGKADVDCEDEKGWTPLLWSVEGGNWSTAKELVKAGANIHHRYEVSEDHAMHACTPMSRAKDKGPEDVVDFFLEMSHSPHVMGSRTLKISQKAGSTPPERYTGIPSANRKRRRS
jgi:ankyrin repeat protein